MANIDERYQKSNGAYFKDPLTGKDLSVDIKRAIVGHIDDNGKFILPEIMLNGHQVKIVYSYWTDEEKAAYKQYRDKGKAKQLAKSVEQKSVEQKSVEQKSQEITQTTHVLFSDTGSKTTIDWIKAADKHLGVSYFDGVLCDTLWVSKENAYQLIPRCLIPYDDRTRLNIPYTRS